jgi:hypothetical protein
MNIERWKELAYFVTGFLGNGEARYGAGALKRHKEVIKII